MEKRYSYHAGARWTTRKRGVVEAEGSSQTIEFAAPPEFGGEPGLWTPEHLLLGAVATCFVATFRVVADTSAMEFHALEVSVDGILEKQEGGFRFTKIILRPLLVLHREDDRERAGRLLEKAERVCLISRSLSSAIILEPKVVVEAPVAV